MKKVFFAFVAVATLALVSCNNKPAEGEGTSVDTTSVVTEPVVETPAVTDSVTTTTTVTTDTVAAK
jgi:uncharacterized lipoprotein NlpE involved in copper resistance